MFKCWFGHVWRMERRATPGDLRHAVVFTLRRCVKCNAIDMLHAGMLGDRNWHPFRSPPPLNQAEQDWFAAATTANYLRLTTPDAGPLLDVLHSVTASEDQKQTAAKDLAEWHPSTYLVWRDSQDFPIGQFPA